jgi:hypothetical protein
MPSKLAKFYTFAAQHSCLVRNCYNDVELHHVAGAVSLKTHSYLARRNGLAEALVVPLCSAHHRTGADSVHQIGEAQFEQRHGLPEGFLIAYAGSLLAAHLLGAK